MTDIRINKSSFSNVWSMPELHSHDSHELYFLLSGTRRHFIEDSIYDLHPNEIVLISKNTLHRTLALSLEKHERYVVNFKDSAVRSLVEKIGAETFDRLMASRCLVLTAKAAQRIRSNLDYLDEERIHPNAYSTTMHAQLLENILLLVLQHGTPKSPVTEKSISRMQEVAHYINENLSDVTLKEAAAFAHMETTYFSKCFKSAIGEGFQEYLTKVRLQKAEQLLEHSSLSVGDIAETCGFSSGKYFSDVFRQKKDCSPSQYRKAIRKTN